ncbi:AmpG family muropeptide MFS transporter [Gimibacter soli]|uniref:MFS transporter n=1 Tax=Gimibacter soli TaxID=3024400 RepID=A0AAE9XUB0_9PROT|nr:MFS transporter [Gimibacter soli]WCL54650.1 MFS transporter [Gimibacter soli]
MNRLAAGLKPYFARATLANFLLGISSGFPLTLVVSLTGIWLARYGVDKKTIGIFALATVPYAWKFLWSPVIDRLHLGPFARLIGHRRSWLFLIQAVLVAVIIALSTLDPSIDVGLVGLLVIAAGFLSASQDIVIDAYRIEISEKHQLAHAAAMVAFGYRAGGLLAGFGTLHIADIYGWHVAILSLAVLVIPGALAALWIGEPDHTKAEALIERDHAAHKASRFVTFFRDAVIMPFKEFTSRDGWLLILAFIFLYKAGDALAAIMTGPLLVDLGFTDGEIADYNKAVGTFALWAGIALGGFLYGVTGTYRALFIAGVLMMATNFVFAWLAIVGHDNMALAITVAAENFATGLGNTVVIAYLSSLCNLAFTATQYALLSSLASQARAIFGTSSGVMVESLGWVNFFILSGLIAIPGLIVLVILWRRATRAPSAAG